MVKYYYIDLNMPPPLPFFFVIVEEMRKLYAFNSGQHVKPCLGFACNIDFDILINNKYRDCENNYDKKYQILNVQTFRKYYWRFCAKNRFCIFRTLFQKFRIMLHKSLNMTSRKFFRL